MLYLALVTPTCILCAYWYAFGIVSTFFVHHMATTGEGWCHILMVIETSKHSSDMSGMKHFLKVYKMYTYIFICLGGFQRGHS